MVAGLMMTRGKGTRGSVSSFSSPSSPLVLFIFQFCKIHNQDERYRGTPDIGVSIRNAMHGTLEKVIYLF